MLKTKEILDEKDKRLRKTSKEVVFPMTKEDKNTIKEMIEYLTLSQIEDKAVKYELRPGMGLAAVQLGILKRFITIVYEVKPQTFETYVVVNPEIISNSQEIVYVEEGEGCLSVNRETEGIVPRFARVTVTGFDENGNKIKVRAREDLAIAFQHEIDHLNGILFVDRIDKKNPYKNKDKYRPI